VTLGHLFDLSFRGRRDRVALEWHGATFTFGDLDARAGRMAAELHARGVRAGDRLAVYLPNGLALIDLYVACTRLGAIVVPINILYRDRELSHILGDADPVAVVAASSPEDTPGDRHRESREEDTRATPVWQVEELGAAAAARTPAANDARLDGDTPAMIVYTSGTTGRSKGALLTHNNLIANAVALLACWQITEQDRLLLPLPLFHVHGLGNGLHCWLASGCRTRLLERFDHTRIADELLDFRPTLFFGVPTMYTRLVDLPADAARRIGAAARLFVSGSAALPAHVFDAFGDRFGHAILERYGMSETLMTISNPCAGERRPGTVGFPLPGVSIRIVDPDGREVADGEVGELLVRGPTVFAGYWRNAEATRAAFTEGHFRTGDLASRDPGGVVTLHGRRGDLIISGGFNIYPREIEDVLEQHPAVAEAAVIGAPDERRGEVPIAYVVRRAGFGRGTGLDDAALDAHCRAQLASFKVPRRFIAVERLPRNALGKVQKGLLRET
jgi:malonyl-CoA/methylmalonyl-CoA synthetase